MRQWPLLPPPWKWFIYWVNPSAYWLQGMLAATVSGVTVRCTESETTLFNPPPGQTCGQYATDLIRSMGAGYLTNPSATSRCGYCQYSSGDEYLATFNVKRSDMWRDFGIFLGFCFSNYMLVYIFIYTVRIKKFTWGFGPLFGGLGKIVDWFISLFQRRRATSAAEEE